MGSLGIAGFIFGCAYLAVLVAMLVATRLPDHHLSSESKEVVKLGLGVIATLTALVLGLLVASAKSTYDAQDAAVKQLATNVRMLDRFLSAYGPEATELRGELQQILTRTVEQLWPDAKPHSANLTPGAVRELGDVFYHRLAELQPKNEAQRAIKARSMDLTTEMAQTRYRMHAQKDSSVPFPFLVVLALWLVTLFAGYGLLAPRNSTVLCVLFVCTLSIAAALFLVLELGKPFAGIIQVPSAPLLEALDQTGR